MTHLVHLRTLRESNRFDREDQEQNTRSTPASMPVPSPMNSAKHFPVRSASTRGSRALYATDGSNYRQVPIGVVIPATSDDVVATVAAGRRFGAPVLSRGGGTSLAGQCCNVAVVMDFSKYMHRVLEHRPPRKSSAASSPAACSTPCAAPPKQHGLTFGPDPATHSHCTLGGMLGNNSCGVHSLLCEQGRAIAPPTTPTSWTSSPTTALRMRVGATTRTRNSTRSSPRAAAAARSTRDLRGLRDNYADLIRQRFPKLPRRVSGYNLDELLPENGFHVARALVGTEGTWSPSSRRPAPGAQARRHARSLVLGYPDVYHGRRSRARDPRSSSPSAWKASTDLLIRVRARRRATKNADLKLLPEGGGWLLVEFGGDSKEDSDAQARALHGRSRASSQRPRR